MGMRTTGEIAAIHDFSANVEHRWVGVVCMQGEEADAVLDIVGENGPEAATSRLSRRDCGDETRKAALINRYVCNAIPRSPTDCIVREGSAGYALTYNDQLGCVSLLRRFERAVEEAPESAPPPARFGFDR